MCDCNDSPFNKLRESWSKHFDKESHNQCSCCCQNQPKPPPKVKGKFGVAYVIETPSRKCKPCGWEVEFNDTPSQIESTCRKMMNWITCPPLGECQEACCCSKPPETLHQVCARCCSKQPKQCCCPPKPERKQCCCSSKKPKKCYCCSTKKKCCCRPKCFCNSESSSDEGCCCSNKKKKNQSTEPPKEEKVKQSKNWISPASNPEKSKTPPKPPLAPLNQPPKKEPDKLTLQVKPLNIPERKNEITPKPLEAINKENKPPVTDQFVLGPKRRKLERKELLKLIKEGKKELEAVRPTLKS